jgi:hypothetical protein
MATDCDVKQLKWFEAHCGRLEKFTHQSKSLIASRFPEPPVPSPFLLEDSRHVKDRKICFEETLNKVVVHIPAEVDQGGEQHYLNNLTNVEDLNNPDDSVGGGADDCDDHDDDSMEQRGTGPASNRPFQELMPMFVSCTNLVQTEGDLAVARQVMRQFHSTMLKRKNKVGAAGNMVSLPEVDGRRRDKRLKPMGLPEKS